MMVDRTRCPMCDEWYDPYGDRSKAHDHPEPQSGEHREDLIKSRLSYEKWLLTPKGIEWKIIRSKK